MESILNQILSDTKAVPFAEINGRKVYTFHDAQKVNKRKLAEEKVTGRQPDLGTPDLQADQIHRKSTNPNAPIAVDPERYFANRYRISEKENGKPQLEVVVDKRAIKGQKTNRVYSKAIAVYILAPNGRGGKGITVIGENIIDDIEFVNDFKKSIPVYKEGGLNKQVVDVFSAIGRYGSKEEKTDDLEKIFG